MRMKRYQLRKERICIPLLIPQSSERNKGKGRRKLTVRGLCYHDARAGRERRLYCTIYYVGIVNDHTQENTTHCTYTSLNNKKRGGLILSPPPPSFPNLLNVSCLFAYFTLRSYYSHPSQPYSPHPSSPPAHPQTAPPSPGGRHTPATRSWPPPYSHA